MATAARCASDESCLQYAEEALAEGHLTAARTKLGFEVTGKRPSSARWLNAAGLLMLLDGDHFSAMSLLRQALARPFRVETHMPAQKTLYWAVHLSREATESNEPIQRAYQALLQTFQQARAAMEESPETAYKQYQIDDAISVHDLSMQRAICRWPTYDRHYTPDRLWASVDAATRWRRRYLDLLKRSLTRYLTRDLTEDVKTYKGEDATAVQQQCAAANYDPHVCEAKWHIGQGSYQPGGPFSQKWLSGLVHLELLIEDIVENGIRGDVVEAGCYTAGTAVLLRAAMLFDDDARHDRAYGRAGGGGAADGTSRGGGRSERTRKQQRPPRARRLILADSFEGIPMPRSEKGKDIDTSAEWPERYVAGEAQARSTLRRHGLLDESVVFVPGYFNESLRHVEATAYALIHIDADAYDSVLDALEALYPKLAVGGHVVVDDFHLPGVRAACRDFRKAHGVSEPILPVPSDHVTTCPVDWTTSDTLTVHPLTVGYWTRRA